MNDTDQYLLDKHGIIVLPESIDHDAYRHVLEAIHRADGKSLTIYCDGDGGYGRNALSIAGLLQQRDITGILVGEAHSCHAVIFSACQARYVHPASAIGVHMTYYSSYDKPLDSRNALTINEELNRGDRQIARIYAQASTDQYDEDYWYQALQRVGSTGVQMIDADELIAMGIARPISDWTGIQRVNGRLPLSIVGEGAGG